MFGRLPVLTVFLKHTRKRQILNEREGGKLAVGKLGVYRDWWSPNSVLSENHLHLAERSSNRPISSSSCSSFAISLLVFEIIPWVFLVGVWKESDFNRRRFWFRWRVILSHLFSPLPPLLARTGKVRKKQEIKARIAIFFIKPPYFKGKHDFPIYINLTKTLMIVNSFRVFLKEYPSSNWGE